ncbi:MAG: DUF1820 family protein [Deltaproteobacteria bacterium]|nr:DUF1820 family protein [Deltaproteobacteria bacterium]
MSDTAPEPLFAVSFRDFRSGENVTVRAREVRDSTLGIAFVAISGFVFDRSGLVVNPTDEALARRFENIRTLHLSIHAILAIEELGPDHRGLTFEVDRSKVMLFDVHGAGEAHEAGDAPAPGPRTPGEQP